MMSPSTAPDLFLDSPATSSVVFAIHSDTSLRWALDSLARDARWRTETVASISELIGRQRPFAPSCLVLDVSRLDFDETVLRHWPIDMPVICITNAGDVSLSVRVMKAGAVDVLTKPVGSAPLVEAVRLALSRSEACLRQEVELNEMRERYASLSSREREVMKLVVSGLMNKQAARELGISEVTVKAHRGRVMRKMRANSFADLVIIAARLRLGHCEWLAFQSPPNQTRKHSNLVFLQSPCGELSTGSPARRYP
jgi:FixJ family two-component response regulator